jgi:sarcosine oxidase, subunit gamma
VTADPLPRTGPLDGWADRFAALPAGLRIAAHPFVPMTDVRADHAAAAALGLPTTPNTWVPRGGGRAIWLGPDEWLVTGDAGGLAGADAVVDVSGQRTTMRLAGEHVRAVLATGCAIDLHPRAFPPGSAAQTLLGLAGVVLLALDDAEFEVLVRTSFARYLADWLLDAAAEYGT